MIAYDFHQPVSIDDVPAGRVCEWCGQPAVYQLTALGGRHHNEERFFCQECGEQFVRAVADSTNHAVPSAPSTPFPLLA